MCQKHYDDNHVHAVTGYQNGFRPAGITAGYIKHEFHTEPIRVPIYVHETAYWMWRTCGAFAPRICNSKNISQRHRNNGYNSWLQCVESLSAKLGYRFDHDNQSGHFKYHDLVKVADADRDNHFILVTADDPLSFFWRWMSYDTETMMVNAKPQMVGGLIFHRERTWQDGEDLPEPMYDGLRGKWSTHT